MSGLWELWVRVAVLGAVAVLAEVALRKGSAALRHALWVAALACGLALPVVYLLAPTQKWTVSFWQVEVTVGEPAPLAAFNAEPLPATPAAPSERRSYEWVWIALYGGISAMLAGRLTIAAWRLRRIERGARIVEMPELYRMMSEIGLARQVETLVSHDVQVPFTSGWRRPRIFLPEGASEWRREKLACVLGHEIEHIRRNDWLTSRIAAAARCLFWAHPFYWWAERRLVRLAEESADQTALALVGDRKSYAGTILDFALARGSDSFQMEATAMTRSSKVGSRIERILAAESLRMARVSAWAATVIALVSLPVLYATAVVEPAPQVIVAAKPAETQGQASKPVSVGMAPAGAKALTQALSAPPPPPRPPQFVQPKPEDIGRLEEVLRSNPDDAATRLSLVLLYQKTGSAIDFERHVLYLVERQPERSEAASATIVAGGLNWTTPFAQRLLNEWKRNVESNPGNGRILSNATQVIRYSGDWSGAEELLIQTEKSGADNRHWAAEREGMYLQALLAHAGTRLGSGNPDPAFMEKAQRLAEAGTEMPLVGLVGEMLVPSGPARVPNKEAAEQAKKYFETRLEIAERILRRAEMLEPDNPRWKNALERAEMARAAGPQIVLSDQLPPPEPGVRRITVGGNVQAAMLTQRVEPDYPPLARQARIQGTVRFTVIIDREGRIKNLTLISGHPLLVGAAQEALRQWEYKPTLLNGEPVEVVTQADVSFTLPARQ